MFLPFTLWHACGWGAVPTSVAIAFLMLGIEEIGVQIEEPCASLDSMAALAGTVGFGLTWTGWHATKANSLGHVRGSARASLAFASSLIVC